MFAKVVCLKLCVWENLLLNYVFKYHFYDHFYDRSTSGAQVVYTQR